MNFLFFHSFTYCRDNKIRLISFDAFSVLIFISYPAHQLLTNLTFIWGCEKHKYCIPSNYKITLSQQLTHFYLFPSCVDFCSNYNFYLLFSRFDALLTTIYAFHFFFKDFFCHSCLLLFLVLFICKKEIKFKSEEVGSNYLRECIAASFSYQFPKASWVWQNCVPNAFIEISPKQNIRFAQQNRRK